MLDDQFMYRIDIINVKDHQGNTALHYATSNNWPQHIIEKLLHVGANLAALNNKKGKTTIEKVNNQRNARL